MSLIFNVDSISSICPTFRDGVAVYGFVHCHYLEIIKSLNNLESVVYDMEVQNEGIRVKINAGEDLASSFDVFIKRVYKAGLVDIIIENYKRFGEGRCIIPVIFCVDIDPNPFKLTIQNIFDRTKKFVTHSELRRAYKLCCGNDINPKIKKIANDSFKFVCVHKNEIEYSLSLIDPPWRSIDCAEALKRRQSQPKQTTVDLGIPSWKSQLYRLCELPDSAQ